MTPLRNAVFALVAYGALLGESALGHLLRRTHAFFAAPELSLFVVVYLGISGRGSTIGLTCAALAIGYLRDLLVGAPRGIEALTFALCALVARLLHGRVFVDRLGQLAVVAAAFALFHAVIILVIGPVDVSLRILVPVLTSALVIGPLVLHRLARIDQRVAPDAGSLRMDGDLRGGRR